MHVSGHALLGGAAHDALAAAAARGDADPRRVPDARGARRSSRARPASRRTRSSSPRTAPSSSSSAARRRGSSTGSRPGVTFVDGLGVGDVRDVALRDRRRLSEDGVLIIVTTLASSNGGATAPPELIARGFGESEELLDELREEAGARARGAARRDDITEIKLLQEHLHDARRPADLRPDAAAADDSPRGDRGMSVRRLAGRARRARRERADGAAADRAAAGLRGRGARVLPAARALGAGRGAAADRRAAARRRSATPPTGSRPRSPGSRRRSAATCSSSRPTRPRAARGTAGRAQASSWSGSRC